MFGVRGMEVVQATMTLTTQKIQPREEIAELCLKCGCNQSYRMPRTLVQKAFALKPYKCWRCAKRQTKLRPGMANIASAAALIVLVAGAAFGSKLLVRMRGGAGLPQSETATLATLQTTVGGDQLSAFEKLMTARPKTTLDNAAILKMWQAKADDEIILQMIRTSNPDYDVSPNAVLGLLAQGVDKSIVLAMIDSSSYTH